MNYSRDDILCIAAKAAYAIQCLHSKRITHLDLSLENVMFDYESKELKLIDFGFSKRLSNTLELFSDRPGKSFYFAPEVRNKNDYDKTVDWYAFGVILYQLTIRKAIQKPFCDIILTNTPDKEKWLMSLVESCTKELENRVQNLEDIKRHKCFKGFNWKKMETNELRN